MTADRRSTAYRRASSSLSLLWRLTMDDPTRIVELEHEPAVAEARVAALEEERDMLADYCERLKRGLDSYRGAGPQFISLCSEQQDSFGPDWMKNISVCLQLEFENLSDFLDAEHRW